jgi:hypothetical protein
VGSLAIVTEGEDDMRGRSRRRDPRQVGRAGEEGRRACDLSRWGRWCRGRRCLEGAYYNIGRALSVFELLKGITKGEKGEERGERSPAAASSLLSCSTSSALGPLPVHLNFHERLRHLLSASSQNSQRRPAALPTIRLSSPNPRPYPAKRLRDSRLPIVLLL